MHVIFLPGGGGAAEFWHPLGALLPDDWQKTYFSWPGLGNQPHDPDINGFDDLVAMVEKQINGPTVLVAQSMGGIVGIRLAAKYPVEITRLVLVATSGGVDMDRLQGEDWRDAYRSNFPNGANWITTARPDLTTEISTITCPTLLIWGDADPLSPLAVGKHFSSLIPKSKLCVIAGGTHNLGRDRADQIAPLIVNHLLLSAE